MTRKRQWMVPLLAGILGGLATFAALGYVEDQEKERIITEFKTSADSHAQTLHQGMVDSLRLLRVVTGLHNSSDQINNQTFKNFLTPVLPDYLGVRAVGWLEHVWKSERLKFETETQKMGIEGYIITDWDENQRRQPAGDRDEYYPYRFLVPEQAQKSVIGFDPAFKPSHRRIIDAAKKSGRAMAVPPEKPQGGVDEQGQGEDQGQGIGIIVFKPLYLNGAKTDTPEHRSENIFGFAAVAIFIQDIIEKTIAEQIDQSGTDIFFYDETEGSELALLYTRPALKREAVFKPLSKAEATTGTHVMYRFELAGRKWAFAMRPSIELNPKEQTPEHLSLLVGGLFATLMLVAYLWTSLRRSRDNEQAKLNLENMNVSLKEGRDQLDLALKGGHLGFWNVDFTTGKGTVNDIWAEILGYDSLKDEDSQRIWRKTIHPDDREKVHESGRKYRAGEIEEYNVEHRVITKTDQIKWVHTKGAIVEMDHDGSPLRMAGTVSDITVRKEAEIRFFEAEKRLQAFFENMPLELSLKDLESRYIMVNKLFEKRIGLQSENIIGQRVSDIALPEMIDTILKEDFAVFETGTVHHFEGLFKNRMGGTYYSRRVKFPVLDDEEGVMAVGTAVIDITDLKQAEQDALEREEQLDAIMNASIDPIFFKNTDGKFERCNQAFLDFLGLEETKVIGKTVHDLFDKEISDPMVKQDLRILTYGKGENNNEWLTDARGVRRLFNTIKTPVTDASGNQRGIVGFSRDITHLKEVEKQLAIAQGSPENDNS